MSLDKKIGGCPYHTDGSVGGSEIIPRPNSTLRELMSLVRNRALKIDISHMPTEQDLVGLNDLERKLVMARYDVSIFIQNFWIFAENELRKNDDFGFNVRDSNLNTLYEAFVWRFIGLLSQFLSVQSFDFQIRLDEDLSHLSSEGVASNCYNTSSYFNAGMNTAVRFLFMPLKVVSDLGVNSKERQLKILEHPKTRALINVCSVLDISVLTHLVGELVEDASGRFLLPRYNELAFKIISDGKGEYLDLQDSVLLNVRKGLSGRIGGGVDKVYTGCPAVQGQVVDSMYTFFIDFVRRFYCLERP
ncbi:hypothetical protein COU74_04375 [Candidatus Peregrinibacteria bacterium CG10_big_fil_rev_8_21_14_0_10_36_19]|nr:MAG: hypothetical protein COU74_04375 [Candidatus Peregrinibacteria bacterium CG10_big_fil_rev_8_21_14_0_10_36_19]